MRIKKISPKETKPMLIANKWHKINNISINEKAFFGTLKQIPDE